jgi:hypothetical protein
MTGNVTKLAQNTFRIPGFNVCIFTDCVCVHGSAYDKMFVHHPEIGNCLTCQIPLIEEELARRYLKGRRENSNMLKGWMAR